MVTANKKFSSRISYLGLWKRSSPQGLEALIMSKSLTTYIDNSVEEQKKRKMKEICSKTKSQSRLREDKRQGREKTPKLKSQPTKW